MTGFDALPSGWTVWNDEEDGRAVLAFRPDVFDTQSFPPECLPTLYVTRGRPESRRPGSSRPKRGGDWHVTLYLEPEISLDEGHVYGSRRAAIEGAVELARRFADGEIDYRALYQVPRDEYFDRLDDLTGRR